MPDSPGRTVHAALDAQLLALLRQDSRKPVSELAAMLGVSRALVYAGIARLEQDGTIDGYTVRIGAAYDQRMIRAHVMLKLYPKLAQMAVDQLAAMPELTALYAIAGAFDMIAMIEAVSPSRLNDVIDRIGMIEGVERTTSSIILATKLLR
ncbi:MAG: Lrp/AsnC family transcriptional regulator [Candidatus Sphingomonas colombiensis]|nr:Lrp/AsnC family transcriptional regulator [Sphingomonas sp.]WEK44797.1 MAG: Lrp/AsnC family transcriptional regulator [Sphingomonas sp.]